MLDGHAQQPPQIGKGQFIKVAAEEQMFGTPHIDEQEPVPESVRCLRLVHH